MRDIMGSYLSRYCMYDPMKKYLNSLPSMLSPNARTLIRMNVWNNYMPNGCLIGLILCTKWRVNNNIWNVRLSVYSSLLLSIINAVSVINATTCDTNILLRMYIILIIYHQYD